MNMTYQVGLFSFSMICYLLAFVGFAVSVSFDKQQFYKYARIGQLLGIIGSLIALGLRWKAAGHPPLSNMYESLVSFATFMALASILFARKHPLPLVEAGISVGAVLTLGIASLFPSEIKPLIPVLQSYWLHLHVSLAFVGEACFALAFVLSYLYCFRFLLESDQESERASSHEKVVSGLIVFGLPVGFVVGMAMLAAALRDHPKYAENWYNIVFWVILPVCFGIFALLLIGYLYLGAIGKRAEKWLPRTDVLDSLTYRAIALGFPLFTVGGLIFGMVWANKSWGRYWGWDPKETWALITFLVYSAYLHVRLTRGWKGVWTASISVLGFLVTMFTLFGVNFLISGLHSYAGV